MAYFAVFVCHHSISFVLVKSSSRYLVHQITEVIMVK